jgi:hypothetical protein
VIRDILRGRLAADPDPHGLRLRGARIAGRLDLENLTTDVNLELKDCYLEEGVLARNAHLTSVLLPGCQIEHPAEPPLDATRLNCSVLVLDGARVIGHAKGGAVLLSGAHIGGSLECDGAELRNDSGPALYADRLQVDQSMFIRYRFTASGSSRYGAVYLVGAHISGHLDCARADLCNYSGPALAAYSLQVGEGMYLTGGFTAIGGGEGAAVDLTNARVGGAFLFAPARLEHRVDSHRRLEVDGLTYVGVPGTISAQGWRDLLRHGTPHYAAQPYQQLAAGYRALGDDRQARETLMAQRDDQLARAGTGWGERLWAGSPSSPSAMAISPGGRCCSSPPWWLCPACLRSRSARMVHWRKPV